MLPVSYEVSYCTYRFGAIIWHDLILHILSLPRDLLCDNLYACVILSPCRKGNSRFTKLLGRLAYEKIWRYNNSPVAYMMARWLPQQIPPFNFLALNTRAVSPLTTLQGHLHSLTMSSRFNWSHTSISSRAPSWSCLFARLKQRKIGRINFFFFFFFFPFLLPCTWDWWGEKTYRDNHQSLPGRINLMLRIHRSTSH